MSARDRILGAVRAGLGGRSPDPAAIAAAAAELLAEPDLIRPRLSALEAAWVIARRDFVAVLFSRAFLFFLLGPLFPVIVGGLAGSIGGEVQRRAMALATILEPLLIVAMGMIVMLIVLAVLMPIIQLNQFVK